MGRSSTTAADLNARRAYRSTTTKADDKSFAYTSAMHSASLADRKVHETLDPKRKNSLGEQIRECLDSDEHPLTVPVVVAFDETGSMGHGPRIIQEKLASLKGLTLRAGLNDVQLCFGAYGDAANNEVAPVQIGQFESGIEMEEWLNNLYLEGNGGGNGGETAGLLLWFLANFSRLDSVEKRDKKGYIFLTGDEISLDVSKEMITKYIDAPVERGYTMQEVIDQVSEMYEVFFLLVDNSSAKYQRSEEFWKRLLGDDHVIIVENLENVSEMVASVLAIEEGVAADMSDVSRLLSDEGVDSNTIKVVGNALAAYGGSSDVATTKTATVVASADNDIDASDDAGAEFL